MNLQQQVSNLLIQQIKNWELANQNYKALETILSRELTVGGIKISIQMQRFQLRPSTNVHAFSVLRTDLKNKNISLTTTNI